MHTHMPMHTLNMASNRQPPLQHSSPSVNDRLFADSYPFWTSSQARLCTTGRPRIPNTDDFEIDWPIIDRYSDDLDNEFYQDTLYIKRTQGHYNNFHQSAQAYLLPPPSPFLNTPSKQANMRSRPTPAPLILSMTAFKRNHLRVPPAPPPSPTLTPPPSPPFCPLYEEHQTLGAFDIPAITLARPAQINSRTHTAHGEITPTSPHFGNYCSSEEQTTDFDDEDHASDSLSGSYLAESVDEYGCAPPPPSIPLFRTTSQPPATFHLPNSSESMTPSRSSPPTPTAERRTQKSGLSASFFDWDPEPEATISTQWPKFKSSKNRDKRRGSESDESQSSKNSSVRDTAERLRRKLEWVFGKKQFTC
ncbi:hypothetical protein AA313_de0208966 [Arthrobotrys entomopaga]|nr:hypothetical protein AA313_de0208966 [Arthrobotrys entomopaga]